MTDTTNISDLPAQQGTNITLEMREKQEGTIPTTNQPQGGPRPIPHHGGAPQQAPPRMQMPAADVGKLVSGIKSASAANLTGLPSRDIPMMTHPHTQDRQSRPNYVPEPATQQRTDYIQQQMRS